MRQEQELISKRQEFVEKSKSKLLFNEIEEKPRKKVILQETIYVFLNQIQTN